MQEIIVKSQKDWDEIPKDFGGIIYIQTELGIRIRLNDRKGLRVVAWENSSVEARGNSFVEARENAQIVKMSDQARLKSVGNSRIVTMPTTIGDYCDYYDVNTEEGNAILYKAVREDYTSYQDRTFRYEINEKKEVPCNPSTSVGCGQGLHVSHLAWAIKFGRDYISRKGDFRIIECAVPMDKVVVPANCGGKVRTSELTVLREVPKDEWGVYGKVMCRG